MCRLGGDALYTVPSTQRIYYTLFLGYLLDVSDPRADFFYEKDVILRHGVYAEKMTFQLKKKSFPDRKGGF